MRNTLPFTLLVFGMMVFSQTAHAQSRKEREAANRALIEERIELLNEDLQLNTIINL